MATIVLLSDLKDLQKQKQQELRFYIERLEELNKKMYFIRKDIELTNFIIELIEKEKITDLRKLLNDSI
jgi:type II secretory pathway component PulJ